MLYTPDYFIENRLQEAVTVQDVLNGKFKHANYPWTKQMEIMQSVVDNTRTAVKAGHNVGKTHIAARAGLWFLHAYPGSVVITTAPKLPQVRDLLWGRWRQTWGANKPRLGGECLLMRHTPFPGIDSWFAAGYTARDEAAFAGYHEENMLFIFDEASGIPDHIYDSVEGMLGGLNTKILLIGNPLARTGRFFEACRDPDYNTITISCLDHPNVVHEKQIYAAAVAPKWPAERAKKWGRDSTMYRVRVAGDFPLEDKSALLQLGWIEECVDIDGEFKNTINRDLVLSTAYGIDLAGGGGGDKQVLVRLSEFTNGFVYEILAKMHNTRMDDVAAEVAKQARPEDLIGYDAVGVGAGFGVMLENEGIDIGQIVPYKASFSPEDLIDPEDEEDQEFENLGAESWWAFRNQLENANKHRFTQSMYAVYLDDDEDLIFQLSDRKYFINERTSKIYMQPKREMSSSCDEADAHIIALRTLLLGGGPGRVRDLGETRATGGH